MTKLHSTIIVAVLACISHAFADRTQVDIEDCRYVLDSSTKKATVQKFIGPTSRKTVTIPDNIMNAEDGITYTVTAIGDLAFYKSNVVTVNFPTTIKTIGNCAFQECPRLSKGKALVLPPGLTSIGMEAFRGCYFTEVNITSSVKTIGESAFAESSLKTLSFELPKSSLKIDNFAFRGCKSLTKVALPSRLTSLGQAAFENCTSLTTASLPGTITKIPGLCFDGCTSLSSITIPSGITTIGWSAFRKCAFKTINLPATIKTIDQEAFVSAALTSITIPSGVKAISWMCFAGCSQLASVTLPATINVIESGAFWECPALRNITCAATTPPDVADESVFAQPCYTYATLNIPKASIAAYSKAMVWEKFNWFLTAGISDLSDDTDTPALYYTIDGINVSDKDLTPGIYIVRKGNKTKRIIIK